MCLYACVCVTGIQNCHDHEPVERKTNFVVYPLIYGRFVSSRLPF